MSNNVLDHTNIRRLEVFGTNAYVRTLLNGCVIEQSCSEGQIAVRHFDLEDLCQTQNFLFCLHCV